MGRHSLRRPPAGSSRGGGWLRALHLRFSLALGLGGIVAARRGSTLAGFFLCAPSRALLALAARGGRRCPYSIPALDHAPPPKWFVARTKQCSLV